MPPNAQPACSEDMIGLPSAFSTATPWLFMLTSCVAEAPPSTSRPAATSSGCGASTGSRIASETAMPPTQTIRSEPCRTIAWPATGKATITAIAIATMIRPIALLERSKRSWIHGICATQVPIAAPLTTKTPVVAQRGRHARVTVTPRAR